MKRSKGKISGSPKGHYFFFNGMLLRHYRAILVINLLFHVYTVLKPFSYNALKSSKFDHWALEVGLIVDLVSRLR